MELLDRYWFLILGAAIVIFSTPWMCYNRKRLTLRFPWLVVLGLLAFGWAVLCVKAFAAFESWD